MPIYQYLCTDCGHDLEALQRMSDPKLTDCPECKKPSLKKQLTAAAFKLNGTGWYETDFKNSGKPPPAKTSDGADKSANTADSKGEATAAPKAKSASAE